MGWIQAFFSSLSHAIEGNPAVAVAAALAWGILSILLSPCHLASIPLIIGFIDEQGSISTRRAFWIALLFSAGILVTIALIGVATALAGRMLGDVGEYGNYVVAVIFFIVGLHLLDVIPLNFGGPGRVNMKRRGLLASFILGLVFGVALGPCTFAFMAPMLAITFKLSAANGLYGAFLLVMYGVGHCGVIVAAGTSYEWIEHYLKWSEASRGALRIKKACGVLVLLGGLWLLYTAP
ncbi:MAG TPA: cytochrome c biogenesis protein CcdA [Kiritimatiellia bacterium]|nr:cytochrome c biogenesis protein CcdA [Kiritimatiellia bacterium]HRZ10939.1 cytochrome c biogenesis protein CcdA [Kiritimatiellia bacterium]HSA18512.1 cytochrome c biogenesis protein CcdA [Kiritimatiellia bacterium]